jgi:hypothetical protein
MSRMAVSDSKFGPGFAGAEWSGDAVQEMRDGIRHGFSGRRWPKRYAQSKMRERKKTALVEVAALVKVTVETVLVMMRNGCHRELASFFSIK